MPIDFRTLPKPRDASRPVDPLVLFRSSRVVDSSINDLWLAQGDALREWNESRTNPDVAIVLNTGAGKTLVGLLAAQSLVNETSGSVLYACSSIQLVRQTEEKARGYGLETSTYTQGQFSNTLYQQGLAPCITTYQALFNGRSIFRQTDVKAVIFDDAHSAGHLLRDQFSLRIQRSEHSILFDGLTALFRGHFDSAGKGVAYEEMLKEQDSTSPRFVPPFVLKQVAAELKRLLTDSNVRETTSTTFAWQHLRDHLDLCAVFVSGADVVFTPPVVPVDQLPYFKPNVRRLYLSATLTAKDGFVRSFGRVPSPIIAPSTTAGECERLILLPSLTRRESKRSASAQVADVKSAIRTEKALVLVPSARRATIWDDVRTNFAGEIDAQIDSFKSAPSPACLVLTARYDGVDFPGDTCRLLVVDDLPAGLNPLEQFLWERLGLTKLLRSTLASRIVQSLGRISRGMSDHGVVVVTGDRLTDWLLNPKNRAALPAFLQKQIRIGMTVSENVGTSDDVTAAIRACLDRDGGWLEYYEQGLAQAAPLDEPDDLDELLVAAHAESRFGQALWERDFGRAARALEQVIDEVFESSRPAGAWMALWLAYSADLSGDSAKADAFYRRAYRGDQNIPAPQHLVRASHPAELPTQVAAVLQQIVEGGRAVMPTRFDIELAALDGAAAPHQVESALQTLGGYLGLTSSRPDNDLGTGPDVLWALDGAPAGLFEAKTNKAATSLYSKDDLGQLRDHRQWFDEHHGSPRAPLTAFVGPLLPPSPESNPDDEMWVIPLAAFRTLRDRLRAALVDVCADTSGDPGNAAHAIFKERRLRWPEVFQELAPTRLKDVR